MKTMVLCLLVNLPLVLFAQKDTADVITLSKETTLSEVVIRSDLNVVNFLQYVRQDTSFYKAFKNLRILGFSSINDVRMLNKKGKLAASLFSKTRQDRTDGCRTMEVLEEKTTGDFYDGKDYNYYTAQLYASLFFTSGKVCGENNIVSRAELDVRNKSGLEKHKEQLKMLFFNPGKKIPGIPFIGDKVDIFSPDVAALYQFSIDMETVDEQECYVFKIIPRTNLTSGERDRIVFDNITTWFNARTMEIVARNYDLSYNTPVYDFDVHMEVKMTRFGNLVVPKLLTYNGNWKVALKKREHGVFTAILYDYRQ